LFSQVSSDTGKLEVSEIVVPQGEKLKHQKSKYFEIYSSHTNLSTPAYWYKIIFKKKSTFLFSLFPNYEEDMYDVFCFKFPSNIEPCDAINTNKIIGLNANRIYKDYNDDEVITKQEGKFMDFKKIEVDAGDVIFLEVIATAGKDCGHILEVKTTKSFFVFKQINKSCPTPENYATDNTIPTKTYSTLNTDAEAIAVLKQTFCKIKQNELMVMSIKMDDENANFNPGLDFVEYNKATTLPIAKFDSIVKAKENIKTISTKKLNDSLNSLIKKAIAQKPLPVEVKSTADFEEPEATQDAIPVGISYNRYEMDKVLFNLMVQDLKQHINANNELIKSESKKVKKIKDSNEKLPIANNIKKLKAQNISLNEMNKETRLKIKAIQRILADKRKSKKV
jgi:hypothetical protein